MREVVPAQRKLAKLVRPDTKVHAEMAKEMKDFFRTKIREQFEMENMQRKRTVQEKNKEEKDSLRRRKETQRDYHLATFRRPHSAKEIERASMPPQEELNGTEILMKEVKRRKRKVQSAKRKRDKSQKHAKMFSNANNSTSRHIARGNALRRKRQTELATKQRVARNRTTTMQRQAIMREASIRKQQQQQAKIDGAREEYKQMLIWRRNVDIQQLEMARLRKQYQEDLKTLVQKVQRGELNQPVWDMEQQPRELLERTKATQGLIPVRPNSRQQGFGAYNGGSKGGNVRPLSRETRAVAATFESNPSTTTFSTSTTIKEYNV